MSAETKQTPEEYVAEVLGFRFTFENGFEYQDEPNWITVRNSSHDDVRSALTKYQALAVRLETEKRELQKENAELKASNSDLLQSYMTNMCQMGHDEIRYADSLCPVCASNSKLSTAIGLAEEMMIFFWGDELPSEMMRGEWQQQLDKLKAPPDE